MRPCVFTVRKRRELKLGLKWQRKWYRKFKGEKLKSSGEQKDLFHDCYTEGGFTRRAGETERETERQRETLSRVQMSVILWEANF